MSILRANIKELLIMVMSPGLRDSVKNVYVCYRVRETVSPLLTWIKSYALEKSPPLRKTN